MPFSYEQLQNYIHIYSYKLYYIAQKRNRWKIFHLNEWQMVVWVSLILYSFSLLNSIEAHAYIFHSQRHNTGYPQCEIEVGCNAWRHICLRDAEHINISDVNFKYWASNWSIQLSFNWNAMQLRFHLVKSSWWYPNFPLLFPQFFFRTSILCILINNSRNKNKMSCRWTLFSHSTKRIAPTKQEIIKKEPEWISIWNFLTLESQIKWYILQFLSIFFFALAFLSKFFFQIKWWYELFYKMCLR